MRRQNIDDALDEALKHVRLAVGPGGPARESLNAKQAAAELGVTERQFLVMVRGRNPRIESRQLTVCGERLPRTWLRVDLLPLAARKGLTLVVDRKGARRG